LFPTFKFLRVSVAGTLAAHQIVEVVLQAAHVVQGAGSISSRQAILRTSMMQLAGANNHLVGAVGDKFACERASERKTTGATAAEG
jgi:hypothetical protein